MENYLAEDTYIKIMQHLSSPGYKGQLNSNTKENITAYSFPKIIV